MHHLARLRADRAGNAAIEFALILPLTVLMVAGLIEYGLVTNARTSLENGARAGAQFALFQGFDEAAITATVVAATNLALSAPNVAAEEFYECDGAWGTEVPADTECDDGAPLAKFVGVTATMDYAPFFPLIELALPSELVGSAAVRVP